MRLKFGFTLAEVLITLGIIGIVAAITIPGLIHNYKKRLIETRLQQTVSMLTDLAKRVEEEEGDISSLPAEWAEFNNILAKHIKVTRRCKWGESDRQCDATSTIKNGSGSSIFSTPKLILPNGVGFEMKIKNYEAIVATITVDLNITSKKMYHGIDLFKMALIRDPLTNSLYISSVNKTSNYWNPYLPHCGAEFKNASGEVQNLIQRCEDPGKDDYQGYTPTYCTALIECNNWKIPKDYPIKF